MNCDRCFRILVSSAKGLTGVLPVLFACLLTWIATGVRAQSISTSGGQASGNNQGLEEIIVTAQRRSENIQIVPMSVQAIDERVLNEIGAKNLSDVLQQTTGVLMTGGISPGASIIAIRGIYPIGGLPTTAMYLDDIPITGAITGYSNSPDPQVNDTARVEVLEGPQGTLYGDSAMGGAIKFISNSPDPTSSSGHAYVEGSTTKNGAASGAGALTLNEPLIANELAVRASVSYRDDGGYLDNVSPFSHEVNDKNENGDQAIASRIAFAFTPDSSLSVTPAFLYQRNHVDATPSATAPVPAAPAAPGFSTAFLTPYQSENYLPEWTTDQVSLTSLNVNKQLGFANLASITGYLDRYLQHVTDTTGYTLGALFGSGLYSFFAPTPTTPTPVPSFFYARTRQLTQEIRLSSSDSTSPFQWTVGAFFENQAFYERQPVYAEGLTANIVAQTGAGNTLATFVPGSLPSDEVYTGDSWSYTKQYAGFGEFSYQITQALKATVGARVFQLQQSGNEDANGFFNGGPSAETFPVQKFTGVDPRFVTEYKITSDNMLYVSASKGFRPGQINGPIPATLCKSDLAALGLTSAPAGAKPDSLWNYEIGSKNEFFDGHLRINGAAFQMNWSDIQLTVGLPTCEFSFQANVGDARVRGAEFDVAVEVLHGLTAGGGGNFLSTEITSVLPDVQFKVGDELPFAPHQFYQGYIEYSHTLPGSVVGTIRGDYSWHGTSVRGASALSDQPGFIYPSYGLANINIIAERGNWSTRLYVHNVTNEYGPTDTGQIFGTERVSPLRPRTIGLSVSTKF
jgi:iron complex outermembrane receptor protein